MCAGRDSIRSLSSLPAKCLADVVKAAELGRRWDARRAVAGRNRDDIVVWSTALIEL